MRDEEAARDTFAKFIRFHASTSELNDPIRRILEPGADSHFKTFIKDVQRTPTLTALDKLERLWVRCNRDTQTFVLRVLELWKLQLFYGPRKPDVLPSTSSSLVADTEDAENVVPASEPIERPCSPDGWWCDCDVSRFEVGTKVYVNQPDLKGTTYIIDEIIAAIPAELCPVCIRNGVNAQQRKKYFLNGAKNGVYIGFPVYANDLVILRDDASSNKKPRLAMADGDDSKPIQKVAELDDLLDF